MTISRFFGAFLPDHPAQHLLVIAACLTTACGTAPPVSAPPPPRPVPTVKFGDAGHRPSYTYPARLHADQSAELAFPSAGRIAELDVVQGERVERGQRLAVLDRRDLQQDVNSALAVHAEARATLARYESVADTGAVSPHEIDLARARARVAAADLSIRRKALRDAELVAPFDGVVAARFVDAFERVQAGQAILTVQSESALEVRVDIPERDMLGADPARPGLMVARLDAAPGTSFPLTLKEYATVADPVTQTFPITLRMPKPDDLDLMPGMTATVEWTPDRRDHAAVRTLPASAVLGAPERGSWVFVVDMDSGTVSRRAVRIGAPVGDGEIEILDGLSPGDAVARAGVRHLRDGMRVRARSSEEG